MSTRPAPLRTFRRSAASKNASAESRCHVPNPAAALLLAATAYGLVPAAPREARAIDATKAQFIAVERCAPCHSATPRVMAAAPKGIAFDDAGQLRANAATVRAQLATRAMPPGNLTAMTEEERAALIAWIDHGR